MRYLWVALLTLRRTSSVLATELTGPVVGGLDGDTIEVLHPHHPERIRLSGTDCPEKGTDNLRADYLPPKVVWPDFISVTGISSLG